MIIKSKSDIVNSTIEIDGRKIGYDYDPLIIAEIGINHNGDIGIAKDLIKVSKDAGCDAVKFQKRSIELVYPQDELDKPRESPWGTTNRQQKEGLEFGQKELEEIILINVPEKIYSEIRQTFIFLFEKSGF